MASTGGSRRTGAWPATVPPHSSCPTNTVAVQSADRRNQHCKDLTRRRCGAVLQLWGDDESIRRALWQGDEFAVPGSWIARMTGDRTEDEIDGAVLTWHAWRRPPGEHARNILNQRRITVGSAWRDHDPRAKVREADRFEHRCPLTIHHLLQPRQSRPSTTAMLDD